MPCTNARNHNIPTNNFKQLTANRDKLLTKGQESFPWFLLLCAGLDKQEDQADPPGQRIPGLTPKSVYGVSCHHAKSPRIPMPYTLGNERGPFRHSELAGGADIHRLLPFGLPGTD